MNTFQQCEHCDYLLPNADVTPYFRMIHWSCGDLVPVFDAHVIRWSSRKRCDCERCLRVRKRVVMYLGGKMVLPRAGQQIPKEIRKEAMRRVP